MNIVIQHVAGSGRESFVNDIINQLSDDAKITVVKCNGDAMDTFKRSLLASDCGHWHLEDDVILCKSFTARANKLINDQQSKIISGFSLGLKSGDMSASSFLWGQCVYIPTGYGAMIAKFIDSWKRLSQHPTGYDLAIRDFLVSIKERYWLESPSLVQHAPVKSLLGNRSTKRQSLTYEGN